MPMLHLAPAPVVVLLLDEGLELHAVEQGPGARDVEEGHLLLARCPRVAVAEQLAREPPAGTDRFADVTPQTREDLRAAERQAEARVDEVRRRNVHVLHPREDGPQSRRIACGDPASETPDRFLGRVDRDDLPAAPQEFGGLEPLTASEVDRQPAAPVLFEQGEDLQKDVVWLPLGLLLVV